MGTPVAEKIDQLAQTIRDLAEEERQALIGQLARDSVFVEDLLDTVDLLRSRGEPTRPYDEFAHQIQDE